MSLIPIGWWRGWGGQGTGQQGQQGQHHRGDVWAVAYNTEVQQPRART